jgi:hypothetical protein
VAAKVEGLAQVNRRLDAMLDTVEGTTMAGLMEAGLQIEGSAKRRVPVERGNLRASGYTRKAGELAVEVGFQAAYAVFVHENLEQKLKGLPRPSGLGEYWGPAGAGPKYLQNAVTENEPGILGIIKHHARTK